jgi:hypothetical protein
MGGLALRLGRYADRANRATGPAPTSTLRGAPASPKDPDGPGRSRTVPDGPRQPQGPGRSRTVPDRSQTPTQTERAQDDSAEPRTTPRPALSPPAPQDAPQPCGQPCGQSPRTPAPWCVDNPESPRGLATHHAALWCVDSPTTPLLYASTGLSTCQGAAMSSRPRHPMTVHKATLVRLGW